MNQYAPESSKNAPSIVSEFYLNPTKKSLRQSLRNLVIKFFIRIQLLLLLYIYYYSSKGFTGLFSVIFNRDSNY